MAAADDEEPHGADDALLLAYLDGTLGQDAARALDMRLDAEPALAARLQRLARGGDGLADAFGVLLAAAPRGELDAMLDGVLAKTTPAATRVLPFVPPRPVWLRPVAAAASLVSVAILAGLIGFSLGGAPRAAEGWHQAVAEYWSLTTAATLALAPSPSLAESQLALASEALGMPLSQATLALDGPSFRGAQLYAFHGKPLVQIAYLDPDYGPIAFCLIRNGAEDRSSPSEAEIDGFRVVRWSDGGVGRMVIGRAPAAVLQRYADALRAATG